MKAAVMDSIVTCSEAIDPLSLKDLLEEWPRQALLVAMDLYSTKEQTESIKGGQDTLLALKADYERLQETIVGLFSAERQDANYRMACQSALFQCMRLRDSVQKLIDHEVLSENDFSWKVMPRYADCMILLERRPSFFLNLRYLLNGSTIQYSIMGQIFLYLNEFLGDCAHPVWTPSLDSGIFAFFHAFSTKNFPLVCGDSCAGKTTLVREASRLLGQTVTQRSVTSYMDVATISEVNTL